MDPRDPRFLVSREEFEDVQMEVKQVHFIQTNHNERLLRLEKRQADEASLKSVWNSPFPSVLGGTPQHGPIRTPNHEEVFDDDFGEQGHSLVGSLHLDADDEPIRRGAASRANSVRFDESAIQGSNWAQNARNSGEFVPIRPGSAFGGPPMLERSLSHKSDGRHSSAGHSVHSFHSVASGRASSLGLEGNLLARDEESPLDVPEPPPGFFVLGSVPSIVRCWLTNTNFVNETVLYADLCSGSQKSTVEFSLVKELDLMNEIHRDMDGSYRVRLPVYLTEASVMQSHSRSPSPPQIPSILANFEVLGMDQPESTDAKKAIQIFIGSDTLRAHSADILLSQNRMQIYSTDRDRLSVPFVRPEDDALFKHLATTNLLPERPRLNATAPEFVSSELKGPQSSAPSETGEAASVQMRQHEVEPQEPLSPPLTSQSSQPTKWAGTSNQSESGAESERAPRELREPREPEASGKDGAAINDGSRKSSIWESWRHAGSANGADGGAREGPLSGYQPPTTHKNRSGMKILKPVKPGNASSARTGAAYELPLSARSSGEYRRKTLGGPSTNENGSAGGSAGGNSAPRWDPKRSLSSGGGGTGSSSSNATGGESRDSKSQPASRDVRNVPPLPRGANPVGGASAFSWMTPTTKPKTPTAAAD